MGYKLNGKPLSLDRAFTSSDGTQYPANWLRNSTEADRKAVLSTGITWEAESADGYDQRFYWSADKPKDLATLKALWINKQKDIANSLLSPTDWKVIRQAEDGTPLSSSDKTYRGNVRTQCRLREATINACSDVAKLRATINGTLSPTIAGTSSNGATEKKQSDGSSYDPKQYNDIANPDLLEDWPTT
tara:strand:- start:33 stop:596 length:564 start_codon:yes stop_codon:yes gene_type:complete